ncbi:hypothetical protein PFISCL1PPCAC_22193, partial [Pristionchus fissidentatus]
IFVILASISNVGTGVFRLLILVIQADNFTGKKLARAITANVIGESIVALIANTVNAVIVPNKLDWRLGVVVGPTLAIPFRTQLAIPIVMAVCACLGPLAYLGEIVMLSVSLPLNVISFFIDGIASSGLSLTQQQVILDTTPAYQRASALSFLRLIIAVFLTPSAQVFGVISDYFRGDSVISLARFTGLQKTFLYTWIISVVSSVMYLLILRFYRKDAENSKEVDRRNSILTAPILSRKS